MTPLTPLTDPELLEYRSFFKDRASRFLQEYHRIKKAYGSLKAYANLHHKLGLHAKNSPSGVSEWCMTEYMPAAARIWLATSRTDFRLQDKYAFTLKGNGMWELRIPANELTHGDYYELRVQGKDSAIQRRVPAFASWVVQDAHAPEQWCARVWNSPQHYVFQYQSPARKQFPRIYEAHVGMAQPALGHTPGNIGSFADFTRNILPRIQKSGYTAVQLMGIPEHPLYKSFGYQVSSYFAPSSRFGTPDEFCRLVDEAHRLGLSVILDITHSHACPNSEQGLAHYDTSSYFFDDRENQWGTPSFDYQNEMTRRFLLSNCRYWLEDFRIDGFRFDAVGNILYTDHGIGDDFSHVSHCFHTPHGERRTNEAGELYLSLANALIHELSPKSLSIAEEFSGMPGLTCPPKKGGLGFDYRFAMGIPDFWGKYIKNGSTMGKLWYELSQHRPYDRTISYVECHDQCINGDDAMIWRIIGDAMYTRMSPFRATWNETRGVALYRLMRGITLMASDAGYMNFMGAEFGHPEWLDEDLHAHRQWHLADDQLSFYAALARLDAALLNDIVTRHSRDMLQKPMFRFIHEDYRLLAFSRGRLLLAFNFHETRAETDFRFQVPPGKYVEILSSDEPRFGGCGNLVPHEPATEHFSDKNSGIDKQDITLYLPPLTMLILEQK